VNIAIENKIESISRWLNGTYCDSALLGDELIFELEQVKAVLKLSLTQIKASNTLIRDFDHVCEDRLEDLNEELDKHNEILGDDNTSYIDEPIEHYTLLKNDIEKYVDFWIRKRGK
jgi:hypothetical protein